MRNKRDLPLELLKIIEPFINLNNELYYTDLTDKELLVEMYDNSHNSNFYFLIKNYKYEGNSGIYLLIEYSPSSNINPGKRELWTPSGKLSAHLSQWTNLLKEYNNTKSFYDDPILEHYEKVYAEDFSESFGDDDQEKPFSTPQQLALDQLFTVLTIELTKQIENRPNEDNDELQIIRKEITEIQESIHVTTKGKVISRTVKILAKIHKLGLGFVKELGTEAKKYLIKKIIDGTIDFTKTIDITNYLN